MQPIGNKYLVKVETPPPEENVGGILVPSGRSEEEVHYRGTIVAHKTYMTKKEFIPVDTKVVFHWKDKDSKMKIILNGQIFYICDPKAILALDEVIE